MKMSDRRLKRILRENPVPIQPEKKEEMIAFARICDKNQTSENSEDGLQMKYIKLKKVRTLIAAAAILSLMAVAVTAGIVNYYYRTPGGNIVDQTGTVIEQPENMSLKMTGTTLSGPGYTIEEVNWLSYNGQSTFTVWMTADSLDVEPQNLHAVIDSVEYPLKKSFVTKDTDGNPLCIGYTTANMPEPQNWSPDNDKGNVWLRCDEPFISKNLYFEPTDIHPVHTTADGITVTGYLYDGNFFYGGEDDVLMQSPYRELIANTSCSFSFNDITDTSGVLHEDVLRNGYGVGSGGIADSCYSIPEGIVPASTQTEWVKLNVHLVSKENVTYCDLPIPEQGETLTGEWTVFDMAGMKITITEITRDKYSIQYYSPDAVIRYNYDGKLDPVELLDDSCFADALDTVIIHTGFGEVEGLVDSNTTTSGQPETGKKWRIAAKNMNEYCETHDTFRLRTRYLELSYRGDWTLTFPEN
ncbi:MAG: hypothetical protein J6N32_01685 [Clostridia bacterium]|nr:hypothetical protein [Clostridia bacterium]